MNRERKPRSELESLLEGALNAVGEGLAGFVPRPAGRTVGRIRSVGKGIARVGGLAEAEAEEILAFPGDVFGLAYNVGGEEIGVVMLGDDRQLRAGDEVHRTGRVLDVPVGSELLGRVVDPLGRPRDGLGRLRAGERRPVERPAPPIMDRAPVTVPLMTGLKAVDALIPIGRGQRELILGDRQTGKSAIAVDTIINQRGRGVICLYCAIGQRTSSVARVIADIKAHDAMDYTFVVTVEGDEPPGLQYIAPYAATSMAEYFMEQGRDVLVVYDDLTRHARAYRELSLLLRRPPGREAYPGDIFYIHSRLLERATHLREDLGGGSLTALPIIETEAQNISAYIPTNLISITDGQLYLSPELFRKGNLPAIDIGKSVSRVGGKTQLAAYRAVAGDLRLTYSQFEELEAFARFGTRLDVETRRTLERGRRVRAVLRQPQYAPLTAAEQILALHAVNRGVLDPVPEERLGEGLQRLRQAVERIGELADRIGGGEVLEEDDLEHLEKVAAQAVADLVPAEGDARQSDPGADGGQGRDERSQRRSGEEED
jgi:F-type H+-transporting ATPase subunit alpha